MSREVKIVVKMRSLTPQKLHGTKTVCRETNSIILSNSAALWTYKYWPSQRELFQEWQKEEFKMQKFHRLVCDSFLFDFFCFFKHINFFFFAIKKPNPTTVEHHQISRLWQHDYFSIFVPAFQLFQSWKVAAPRQQGICMLLNLCPQCVEEADGLWFEAIIFQIFQWL